MRKLRGPALGTASSDTFIGGCSHVPSSTSLTYFFAFLGTGLLFEILAFSIFLPVIVLAPAKFALCFTIGSALMMASFISLKGWQQQLSHMMSPERLPFSLGTFLHCMLPPNTPPPNHTHPTHSLPPSLSPPLSPSPLSHTRTQIYTPAHARMHVQHKDRGHAEMRGGTGDGHKSLAL